MSIKSWYNKLIFLVLVQEQLVQEHEQVLEDVFFMFSIIYIILL